MKKPPILKRQSRNCVNIVKSQFLLYDRQLISDRIDDKWKNEKNQEREKKNDSSGKPRILELLLLLQQGYLEHHFTSSLFFILKEKPSNLYTNRIILTDYPQTQKRYHQIKNEFSRHLEINNFIISQQCFVNLRMELTSRNSNQLKAELN